MPKHLGLHFFKKYFKLSAVLLAAVCLASCIQKKNSALLIATSANMQFAMEELVSEFEGQTGVSCEIVLGSSGKLTALITEGAPYHVFVSADMEYPMHLFKEGMATAPPEIYAQGELVLWSIKDSLLNWENFDTESIEHFVIPNPKIAPYGRAAVEAIKKAGFYEQLETKLVLGENVAQTAQYMLSGAANYGIVSRSIVSVEKNKNLGKWTPIPESHYSLVSQGAVLLKSGNQAPEARAFYNFLFSERGMRILNTFGYDAPPS